MLVLGIESTAHTFGISILKDKKIIVNKRSMATTEKGGLIPVKVAEHHEKVADNLLKESLKEANISIKDIDLIAVSNAPGMGHALRIGVAFARAIALRYNKPIVGVNHCIAHLEVSSLISDSLDPILLYCSGANTQIIAYEGKKFRIFGETLDMGVGNFLDSFARELGLGFPGGPKIELLANNYKEKKLIELPYGVKGMDITFAGLLSKLSKLKEEYSKEALAFSVQETIFAMLVEVTERALAHTGKKEVVLGGGVACNKRLQEMVKSMASEREIKVIIPDNSLLVDNAAMIAWAGLLMFKSGLRDDPKELFIKPYERTDDVKVTWR